MEKAETRRRALDRHAMTRKLERRERWLERAGITKELLLEAVQTLQRGMRATKILERGPRAGEEVPDEATRIKAAAEVADFIRLTVGLTKQPQDVKSEPAQVAIVVNVPDWLVPKDAKPVVPAIAEETEVVEAEITDAAVDAEKEDDYAQVSRSG